MRLFAAVYPSAAALGHLANEVESLPIATYARDHAVNVRLADSSLWHVTVTFIGEVAEDLLDSVVTALDVAAASTPATEPMRLAGGGTFGRGRFTTAWVGLLGGDLHPLARAVAGELRRARIPYDRKPFRAHLTIGRPGDRAPREVLDESLDQLTRYVGPSWPVAEVCLVSSHLGPRPEHELLHRAQLNSRAPSPGS